MGDDVAQALGRARGYLAEVGGPDVGIEGEVISGLRPAAELRSALLREPIRSLDPALAAFLKLDRVRALRSREVGLQVAGLLEHQRPDGSFGSEESPADRLARTALLGTLFIKSFAVRPKVLDAIEGFLARHWSPDRVASGPRSVLAGYAAWYALQESELSDPALQWCGRELGRGLAERRFDALDAASVLFLCEARALPGSELSSNELLGEVLGAQSADGSWAGARIALESGPIEATLEAMAVVAHWGGSWA